MNEEAREVGYRRSAVVWGLLALVFVVLWVAVNLPAAFLVSLFLAILALRVRAWVPLSIAAALLVLCPLLLVLKQDGAADLLAELSYFFLAVGVVLLLAQHIRIAWRAEVGEPSEGGDDTQGTG